VNERWPWRKKGKKVIDLGKFLKDPSGSSVPEVYYVEDVDKLA